jgi:hypothetical protein
MCAQITLPCSNLHSVNNKHVECTCKSRNNFRYDVSLSNVELSNTPMPPRLSMNTLRAAFPGQLLSRFGHIQWPSNSPDLTAAHFFLWGIWKLKFLLTPSQTLAALKMQFVRRLRMLRRTLSVASWPVYLGDGSNALIIMEDIPKMLYWRCEAFFCESKTLTYLAVFSCISCCVQ